MRRSFNWIRKGALAGSAAPGLLAPLGEDLAFLREMGIRLVINLTEEAPLPEIAAAGFLSAHFPIADMTAPTFETAHEVCRTVLGRIEQGEAVLLHCRAGLGRTGTLLACCLVGLGSSAEDAVRELRRVNHHYIQTEQQEHFVSYFFARSTDAHGPAVALPPLRLKL